MQPYLTVVRMGTRASKMVSCTIFRGSGSVPLLPFTVEIFQIHGIKLHKDWKYVVPESWWCGWGGIPVSVTKPPDWHTITPHNTGIAAVYIYNAYKNTKVQTNKYKSTNKQMQIPRSWLLVWRIRHTAHSTALGTERRQTVQFTLTGAVRLRLGPPPMRKGFLLVTQGYQG